MTATNTTYNIKLPLFEGPFDLLLFFIERDELDIFNIPIAKITDDFLGYIRQMEAMNIDLASEFILVAATLMRIKAKMLIPRKPLDEEGNEIDPRDELVQRLLEYKRYKSVLDEMREMEEKRSKQNPRGNVSTDLKVIANKALVDLELESLTLFKLMKTFQKVVERYEDATTKKNVHTVVAYNYTIGGQQIYLLSKIKNGAEVNFLDVFGHCENRIHAIVTFLAMLELLNLSKLKVVQGEGVNNFWLSEQTVNFDDLEDVVHEDELAEEEARLKAETEEETPENDTPDSEEIATSEENEQIQDEDSIPEADHLDETDGNDTPDSEEEIAAVSEEEEQTQDEDSTLEVDHLDETDENDSNE